MTIIAWITKAILSVILLFIYYLLRDVTKMVTSCSLIVACTCYIWLAAPDSNGELIAYKAISLPLS